MKKVISLVVFAIMFAACSSPKYSYHFDRHDYNSGMRAKIASQEAVAETLTPAPPMANEITAGTEVTPAIPNPAIKKEEVQAKINSLTKEQRVELKKELKTELKKIVKSKKAFDRVDSSEKTNEWDYDLKMAAIFGAIGVVLTSLWGVGPVFGILGAISLVVAVIFLIKWLARQ